MKRFCPIKSQASNFIAWVVVKKKCSLNTKIYPISCLSRSVDYKLKFELRLNKITNELPGNYRNGRSYKCLDNESNRK